MRETLVDEIQKKTATKKKTKKKQKKRFLVLLVVDNVLDALVKQKAFNPKALDHT